jgi:hypothetical protein
MKIAKLLAIYGCLFVLASPSSTGHAQGAFLTRCAQILMNYIGKPFAKGAAEAAGGEVAKYLLERRSTTIGQGDIQQLQRRGLTECEIRQQVEAIYLGNAQPNMGGGPPNMLRRFSAQARCSVTGAIGTAHGFATPQEALEHAIYDCAYRGGIPACCQHGAYLTNE